MNHSCLCFCQNYGNKNIYKASSSPDGASQHRSITRTENVLRGNDTRDPSPLWQFHHHSVKRWTLPIICCVVNKRRYITVWQIGCPVLLIHLRLYRGTNRAPITVCYYERRVCTRVIPGTERIQPRCEATHRFNRDLLLLLNLLVFFSKNKKLKSISLDVTVVFPATSALSWKTNSIGITDRQTHTCSC